MNFFRKKDRIFASFKKEELLSTDGKIAGSLLSLQSIPASTEVRLNIAEAETLSLKALGCILAFGKLMQEDGVSLTLEGASDVVDQLQVLGFNAIFDAMQKEVKSDVG